MKVENEPDNPNRRRLTLNGETILDWFKQKYQEVQATISRKPNQSINTEKRKDFVCNFAVLQLFSIFANAKGQIRHIKYFFAHCVF